jgi:hypothetical protein
MFGFINDSKGQIEFITRGNHERWMPIEKARNEIAKDALARGHEWLFFFDSDATAEYGTLKRLLDRQKPFIGALCFKRKDIVTPACGIQHPDYVEHYTPPPVDEVYQFIAKYGQLETTSAVILPSTPEGSLLEVDTIGTHCTLIHRSVLEAVQEPRFERTTPPESGATGSDYDFCHKAKAAGVPIYVDMSVISGHLSGAHELAGLHFMESTIFMKVMSHQLVQEKD